MNVGFYATTAQAKVMSRRTEIENSYDKYPDMVQFWAFIDLVSSSNYRIVKGPKAGYVRGETFFSMIDAVVSPCPQIRTIKEIGDAVLLACDEPRPLVESAILIRQVVRQLASVAGGEQFPFDVRIAIGFGTAKRLTRPHEDFLSASIDQLARLMGIASKDADFVISDDAYKVAESILNEYASVVTTSNPIQLDIATSKAMLRDIYYRRARIDYAVAVEFREHFVPWKGQTQSAVNGPDVVD